MSWIRRSTTPGRSGSCWDGDHSLLSLPMGENLYFLFNLSVLPFWLMMIASPGAPLTRRLVRTPAVPLLYAVLYLSLLGASVVSGSEGSIGSLAGLRQVFESDAPLLLAWVHYLCFDMVIGMWEVREAQRRGISGWLLAPCLLLTLMYGPVGFLAFVGVRWFKARTFAWGTAPGPVAHGSGGEPAVP
jgi:hypothetical protein